MRKSFEITGWKPKSKWLISVRRGDTEKIIRSCDSLQDGRETAESFFKCGWDEAWIFETP